MVQIRLDSILGIPRARGESAHPCQRLTARTLPLGILEQRRQIAVGINNADHIRHHSSLTCEALEAVRSWRLGASAPDSVLRISTDATPEQVDRSRACPCDHFPSRVIAVS